MISLLRWGFHCFIDGEIIHNSFFGPLIGDFVAGAFVLIKWANVKVTVINKI
jgi:hypothetical protein